MPSTSKQLPPELLAEVARKLTDTSDISRFSRCSRVSYDLITPLLFRHIAVPLENISAIAGAFRRKPQLAIQCCSLRILGTSDYLKYSDNLDEESRAKVKEAQSLVRDDLATMLEILGEQGNLKVFSFPTRQMYGNSMPITTRVWRAFSGLSGSLVELDLKILSAERYTWAAFCVSTFPKLRSLCLNLVRAHDWDCVPLQKMFHGLKELESLYLNIHWWPDGLNMSSSHPRLRIFYLSTLYFPDIFPSFLQRHPSIERFCLESSRDTGINIGVLPHLKSLCIARTTLAWNPGMLFPGSQPLLTHLRLEYMPDLTTSMVLEYLMPMAATLRHLELLWMIEDFRFSIPFFANLLLLIPGLERLVILTTWGGISDEDEVGPLSVNDLSSFLLSIDGCTSIINLRISHPDGRDLPQSFLDDMGEVPRSLRYLCWDLRTYAIMYRIQSHGEKTIAVKTDLGKLFPGDEADEFSSWLAPVKLSSQF